ncbi:MAG TPA: ABC transporter permease [Patescibacteria group bacterium]|nr:ABC transporter permease [Patescibacteria group bacterium]
MFFSDLLQETQFALSANKSRSALTILGIVIGIASVISMVAIGQGASLDIKNNFQSLGANLLMVMPGSSRNLGSAARSGFGSATTLVLSDAQAIQEQIKGIAAIAPTVSSRQQVKTNQGTNTNTNIYGVLEDYAAVNNLNLASGSFINASQAERLSKVAVVGPSTRDDLFGEEVDPLGQKIRIGSLEFTIIGLTQSKGGSGFNNADDVIYIPLNVAQRYFTGNDALSSINVQVTEEKQMPMVQQEIINLLLARHRISDAASADFSVINQTDIISAVTEATGTMTLLLAAIAGISLLVGGIGIMNMMLTTVTERTKEIGLRKSLGAKNRDINNQFLAEAVALTFIGGVIGIVLGWAAAALITKFSGTTTLVTGTSILLAASVAAGIGIVFGYYPALRASKLNPIEALRYE